MVRRLASLIALLAALACVGAAAPAARGEGGSGHANTALAVTVGAHSTDVRAAFDVRRTSGSTVDPGNTALTVASCTSSRTIAIAMHVASAPHVHRPQPRMFTPANLAIALNDACRHCQRPASAYQDIVQT